MAVRSRGCVVRSGVEKTSAQVAEVREGTFLVCESMGFAEASDGTAAAADEARRDALLAAAGVTAVPALDWRRQLCHPDDVAEAASGATAGPARVVVVGLGCGRCGVPSWVGLSHVAKREAERDKKDGKTFGCSYEDIMKSHEVAKQKSPYPLPRSRVTGKEGGPQSVLPPTPKKLAMDDVALEEQDVNFEDMVFEDADATQGDAQTLDENDFCFEELPGDGGDAGAGDGGAPPPQTPEPVALEGLDMSDLSFEECADETPAREPPSHKEDMKWTDDDFAASREAAPGETAEKAQPSTTSTPRSSFTRGSVCLPRPGESEGSGLGDVRARLAAAEDAATPEKPPPPTPEPPSTMGRVFRSPNDDEDFEADEELARLRAAEARLDRAIAAAPKPPPPPPPPPPPGRVAEESRSTGRVAEESLARFVKQSDVDTFFRGAGADAVRSRVHAVLTRACAATSRPPASSAPSCRSCATRPRTCGAAPRAALTLSVDEPRNKVLVVAAGCLDPLVALLNDGDARVAEEAAGCLWSLAIDDRNKVAIVAAGALPKLAMLLRESGDEPTKTVEHAAGVLQNLAMLDEHQKPIYDAGCLPALVALLSAAGDVGRENAAGCLRNLATADDLELEVAAAGAPEPLCALLFHGTPLCAANAHGALQNMTFQAESRLKVAALWPAGLADDAATLRRKPAVAPPAKSGGRAFVGDCVC
ncbi:hypothetical protein JL722_13241 [Aureococcus anophagefferens]|nr:hypothetical protein JL722_13241 [Aureococcus anophagefferens]